MPIIAGLGNPGSKYSGTRHNIGFELIDMLADTLAIQLGPGKGPFAIGKGRYKGHALHLVKPTTFMNNSGDAIYRALSWYKEERQQCLICYDDLNLDVGTIRLRRNGSAGGHNGIKDIIQKLGSKDFPRLRIGIGNDYARGQQIAHVLSPFSKEERADLTPALDKATDAVFCFIRKGIEQAMNDFN